MYPCQLLTSIPWYFNSLCGVSAYIEFKNVNMNIENIPKILKICFFIYKISSFKYFVYFILFGIF